MFKRIQNILKLSGKDPKAIEELTQEQIDSIPEMGDGKAVFFGEGTEAEFKQQQNDDMGIKGIFGL